MSAIDERAHRTPPADARMMYKSALIAAEDAPLPLGTEPSIQGRRSGVLIGVAALVLVVGGLLIGVNTRSSRTGTVEVASDSGAGQGVKGFAPTWLPPEFSLSSVDVQPVPETQIVETAYT